MHDILTSCFCLCTHLNLCFFDKVQKYAINQSVLLVNVSYIHVTHLDLIFMICWLFLFLDLFLSNHKIWVSHISSMYTFILHCACRPGICHPSPYFIFTVCYFVSKLRCPSSGLIISCAWYFFVMHAYFLGHFLILYLRYLYRNRMTSFSE